MTRTTKRIRKESNKKPKFEKSLKHLQQLETKDCFSLSYCRGVNEVCTKRFDKMKGQNLINLVSY
jgi:hypothetical protein